MFSSRILTCPSCSTRYQIDPSAIGAKGRTVRCVKCGHRWHEDAPAELPKTVEEPAPEPIEDLPPSLTRDDFGSRARPASARGRRETVRRKSGKGALIGWLALILILGAIGGGGYVARDTIVAAWPPAGMIYEMVGVPVERPNKIGLEIKNLTSRTVREGSGLVLVVEGEVENITADVRPVPRLRIALRDGAQREIYHWTSSLEETVLAPGGLAAFTTRLASPPAETKNLSVTFVESDLKTE